MSTPLKQQGKHYIVNEIETCRNHDTRQTRILKGIISNRSDGSIDNHQMDTKIYIKKSSEKHLAVETNIVMR